MGKADRTKEPARDRWLRRQIEQATGAGKGDAKRQGDDEAFRKNYEEIFGPPKLNVWDESDPDHPRHKPKESNE